MKEKKILLARAGDVKEFVSITQNFSFPIELRSGKYIVDAKSILGIFSLDLSVPVTMTYDNSQDEDLFEEKIKKFEV